MDDNGHDPLEGQNNVPSVRPLRTWKQEWESTLSFEHAKELLRDNHMINIRIRKDGEWHEIDADWMKALVRQEYPK